MKNNNVERCYSYCTCYSPYFFYVQNTYTQTIEQKTVLTKSGAESPACHTERKECRFRIKAEQRRKYHR